MALRVVVVGGHAGVRSELCSSLIRNASVSEVAAAPDADSGALIAGVLGPDVIVLDTFRPDGRGLEAISLLRRAAPETRVVVVSLEDDRRYVEQALRLGASGYIRKDRAGDHLGEALLAGTTYVCPAVAGRALKTAG